MIRPTRSIRPFIRTQKCYSEFFFFILFTFTIDFETAKRYREANKMPHQFRRAAWTDLTVDVYL